MTPLSRKTPLKRSGRIQRSTPVKKRNPKRRQSEFARCYHSRARVRWVKSLPCAACGVMGVSENAHMVGGGMGRKAGYETIAPLCGPHRTVHGVLVAGCHREAHVFGIKGLERFKRVDLSTAAEQTQDAWLAHTALEGAA